MSSSAASSSPASLALSSQLQLTDDGGWCWFESPRAVVHPPWLLVGSVSSGHRDPSRMGNVELLVHSLTSHVTSTIVLHREFELDDHDCPAIHLRTDGRFLCTWAKHGTEALRYYRLSSPNNPLEWGDLLTFTPSPTTQLTYSNLFYLSGERRLYDFFRGLHGSFKPSYLTSDDEGSTWTTGHILIQVPSTMKHRPYVKYASNGIDTVHLIYSEAHPRDYDNSIYHCIMRGGQLLSSTGHPLAPITEGLSSPDKGTLIYKGDAHHVAWPTDVVLHDGAPTVVYSVQLDSAGLPVGEGGHDIRYRYARWVGGGAGGGHWIDEPLAYAGHRLYSDEDDYTGLVAIEPEDAGVVYVSTSAHPGTGVVEVSTADGKRHWELWKGTRGKGGEVGGEGKWTWEALTMNSSDDQLRPIRPVSTGGVGGRGGSGSRVLVWLKGEYRAWVDYTQSIQYAEV